MSNQPSESEEIALLDKVLTTLGLAEQSQLEKHLSNFLVPTLHKLSSPHEGTRKKVLEVLGHINKRVKPAINIQLPLGELVQQYIDPSSPFILKNFLMIYLDMGWYRASVDTRLPLIQNLIQGISTRPAQHQESILHMILSVSENMNQKVEIKFPRGSGMDMEVLISFFLDVLITPSPSQVKRPPNQPNPNPNQNPPPNPNIQEYTIPAGHNVTSIQRVLGKNFDKYNVDNLLSLRTGIINLTGYPDFFTLEESLPLLIIGSVDAHHTVVQKSEDILKKHSKVDLENQKLVEKLFFLMLGSPANTPESEKRTPVSPQARVKILGYMPRSILCANKFPYVLQIIFQGIYGKDSFAKLKQATMGYVQWVFRHGKENFLFPASPILFDGLKKLLDQLGTENSKETVELKVFTYTAIGLLGKRATTHMGCSLEFLRALFNSLGKEDAHVSSTIYDTLGSLKECFSSSNDMEKFLLEQINNTDHTARLMAITYSLHIFPFSNILGRYISILGVGDSHAEVRDQARRGLTPFILKDREVYSLETAPKIKEGKDKDVEMRELVENLYPSFSDTISIFVNMRSEKSKGIVTSLGNASLASLTMTPQSYEQMLIFLRRVLHSHIEGSQDKEILDEVLSDYRGLIELGLGSHAGDDLHFEATTSLLDLFHVAPSFSINHYNTNANLTALKGLLFIGRSEARDTIAKVIGLVSSSLKTENLFEMVNEINSQIEDISLPILSRYGLICTLGYTLGKYFEQNNNNVEGGNEKIVNGIERLFNLLSNTNSLLVISAVHSIGVIARYSPLPLPYTLENSNSNQLTKKKLVDKIISLLNGDERKLVETCVITLGYISLGEKLSDLLHSNDSEPNKNLRESILQGLYKMSGNKNEEIQFTVGESLSCIGGGEDSLSSRDPFVSLEIEKSGGFSKTKSVGAAPKILSEDKDFKILGDIIQHVISSHLTHRQTSIQRTSACIWLLSLVKYTGHLAPIQIMLLDIQDAFSSLLADSSEVTQEVAARGLSLVHEKGDEKTQKILVDVLVKTLYSGAAPTKAAGSEEILPQGSIGNAPKDLGGGSLTTYKELCAVANEMGQPDIIYKFLNLSNHHSVWNSRKGAAFATAVVAQQASEQLKPFLPRLIPKLYRYSYDPSPKVSASMSAILSTLVSGTPRKALEKYWIPIVSELLQGMGSKQWRVREGSCNALAEALVGKGMEDVGEFLPEMYTMAFRALDDIKETVRKSAQGSLRTLGGLTVRMCDPNYSSTASASKALSTVLPLLLHKGLSNDAVEVRSFTISQILKISKAAGPLLTPHVPDLAIVALESLTVLEPQEFNYMSFHAEKMEISAEQLETARMAISKLSPLNETVELCGRFVDQTNIEKLMSSLIPLIKGVVGLPSRIGVAKFLSQITQNQPELISPYVPKIIPPLIDSLQDRSTAVRKSFAITLSNVVKIAKRKDAKVVIEKLIEVYRGNENEVQKKEIVGVAFRELMKNAVSALKTFEKDIVPFLYFGKNDPAKSAAEIFKDVWNDSTLSSARLYINEILETVNEALQSNSWVMKQQGALTLSCIGTEVGRSLSAENTQKVLELILGGLKSRTYKGKEALLTALSTVATSCKEITLTLSSPTPQDLFFAAINECQRTDLEYRRHAMICLTNLLKNYTTVNIFDEVKGVLISNIESPVEEVKLTGVSENIDSEEMKKKPLLLLIKASAFEGLGFAYASSSQKSTEQLKTKEIIHLFILHFPTSTWKIQQSILTALNTIIESHSSTPPTGISLEAILSIFEVIKTGLSNAKYSEIRKASLDLLSNLLLLLKKTNTKFSEISHPLKEIAHEVEILKRDPAVTGIAEKAKSLIDNYYS